MASLATAPGPPTPMAPLTGDPLAGPTGLRFLIAADPPVILDVDRDSAEVVPGIPAGSVASVERLGSEALVSSWCSDCGPLWRADAVDHESRAARPVVSGSSVTAAVDGRGVWVLAGTGPDSCRLRRIEVSDGAQTVEREADCRLMLRDDTTAGLIMSFVPELAADESWDELWPAAGPPVRMPRIHGATAEWIIGAERSTRAFVLTSPRSGERRELPRPTDVGRPGLGLPSPDGRSMAFSFEHPAWPGPVQRMDVWLLDLATFEWRRAPSMPVGVALKVTDLSWTPDGRIVVLGEFDQVGQAVAVWRPGAERLQVRPVRLPAAGADSFVVW